MLLEQPSRNKLFLATQNSWDKTDSIEIFIHWNNKDTRDVGKRVIYM